MFYVYYSNQLENHKELLVNILSTDPNPNPFVQETVLVQSLGMAQWLQMQIAEQIGVSGNVQFPYPTSFLWQQYRLLFPDLPAENLFDRNLIVWRLMRIIPTFLAQPEFSTLAFYLQQPDQLKQYQLAAKIADLFDQYLVYRPHWLVHWEKGNEQLILNEIRQNIRFKTRQPEELEQTVRWQGILWNELVEDIRKESSEEGFNTSHRAYLQQRYFDKLDSLSEAEKAKLPERLFIFGITALPVTQLAVLKKLSEFCNIHLFFTNPSEEFWGDQLEDRVIEKLALNENVDEQEIQTLLENQGNPLLSSWGKQGKEFLNLILEQEPDNIVPYYNALLHSDTLLTQVKRAVLRFENQSDFSRGKQDNSIQIHACHSKMREVEVLHNHLLDLFEQNPGLAPKDIIVMSADIDGYAPYIESVFSRYDYQDNRYIPFTLSDQTISRIDPIVQSFLSLLSIKEKRISVDEIFDLLNVNAIRRQYGVGESELERLREWIKRAGIRAGLQIDNDLWQNYNSWENGLNRLLLGSSLSTAHGVWQETVGLDESYGLSAELSGILAKFMENLTAWYAQLQQPQPVSQWQTALLALVEQFYIDDEESAESRLLLQNCITLICGQIDQTHFHTPIDIEVLVQRFSQQLGEQRSNLNFLVGKVNFCTLLPMRAIPFKVVCLLGMNDGEFPRQQTVNSFDLMQYAYQKGDRAKRDDDRYLFLEALLSAQETLYISYIGRALKDNQKKYPSILVAQLIDYVNARLDEKEQLNVQEHPMTVFSPNNFKGKHFSYDKEWLFATETNGENSEFLTEITDRELPCEIELEQLIRYVQDPLKFYFNTHLGVRFETSENEPAESELFNLSGLERYNFFEDLMQIEPEQNARYFDMAKFQGNLPACAFGELAVNELNSTIAPFKAVLSPYLNQLEQRIEINYSLEYQGRTIRLHGSIPNRIDNEIVLWRVGDLRDKDCILAWIYHLLLQCDAERPPRVRFYYRKGKKAECLEFQSLTKTEAEMQLQRYIHAYLSSFTRLTWAISEKIDEALELESLHKLLNMSDNTYLQRVMAQSRELNIADLHQTTRDWFELMKSSMANKEDTL